MMLKSSSMIWFILYFKSCLDSDVDIYTRMTSHFPTPGVANWPTPIYRSKTPQMPCFQLNPIRPQMNPYPLVFPYAQSEDFPMTTPPTRPSHRP